jgi:hypothetical protein
VLKFTNKYLNLLYVYNICHSALDLLYFHGFFWEGAGGKGRGKDARKKGKKANLKKWVLTSGISGYVVTWKFQLVNPWPLNISRAHATTLEHQRCKLMIPTLAYFDTALESSCKTTYTHIK